MLEILEMFMTFACGVGCGWLLRERRFNKQENSSDVSVRLDDVD